MVVRGKDGDVSEVFIRFSKPEVIVFAIFLLGATIQDGGKRERKKRSVRAEALARSVN